MPPEIASSPKSFHGTSSSGEPIAPDIQRLRVVMVNGYYVGTPEEWVLIDAGLPMSAAAIRAGAEARFGPGARPSAIVMTHAHFDHVGALIDLAEEWDVPVYAHELELPYLTGRGAYPPPDPTVGGGMMARLSSLYPRQPIDISRRVQTLPADGSIPHMSGWRWISTPGHSPGHVSFFRDSDRVLIAGDAVVTTKQESLLAVLTQRQELHGPPMYFTQDWHAARESVRRLAELNPSLAATGHGVPMSGPRLPHDLHQLADHFEELAVPTDGRYVRQPALADQRGTVYVPPAVSDPMPKILIGDAVAVGALSVFAAMRNREDD